MAVPRVAQGSFTGGMISRALWARTDLEKYAKGLKEAKNVFVHPAGGISNRAGLEFVAEVHDSARETRLIDFDFGIEQTYVLEFGHETMRVIRDGGIVLDGPSPYVLTTDYVETELFDLVTAQEADVMYIAHENHGPNKLGRLADDNWTLDALTFAPTMAAPTGLIVSPNYVLPRSGGTSNIQVRVTAVGSGGEESAVSGLQSTGDFYFDEPEGTYMKIEWTASPGAVLYRVYRVDSGPGLMAETPATEIELRGIGADNSRPPPGGADPGAPSTPTITTADVEFGRDITYVVSAVSEETGEESLPSSEVTTKNDLSYLGNKNILSWSAVAGAEYYRIYKKQSGSFGYIGTSDTTTFVDENVAPDTSSGPQVARNPFPAAGDYPRAVSFIDQRLAFASTGNNPQAVFLSQSANYENFGVSRPARASDAITLRIRARKVSEIRAILPMKGMIALTSGGEFTVTGGSDGYLTPSNPVVEHQSNWGASRLQPIMVGKSLIYALKYGGICRDMAYQFADDGYSGRDLTVFSRDLFEGKEFKAWAYAQSPYSIVWSIMDDGSLLSLTYVREHEVWAWTRHETDGVFESVCVIGEDGRDVPYFVVRRTIDGVQRRYIERMRDREVAAAEDGFFVDCGLTYDGVPTDTLTGLDHLEGETLVALADGNVVRDLVVSGGSVTLPREASLVHIGLPYEAEIETLELDLGTVQGYGSTLGRKKSVASLTVRVKDSRGMFAGPDRDRLVEWRQRQSEGWGEPIELFTGDVAFDTVSDWSEGAPIVIRQSDPLPMTILGVMPEIVVGG